MRKLKPNSKSQSLQERGCLNPKPLRVRDPLFSSGEFFDSKDIVQVKYEMIRRSKIEQHPIAQSAAAFGFSRPSFYKAQKSFEKGGLPALVPQKTGPRRRHKLDSKVMDYLHQEQSQSLRPAELAAQIKKRFGLSVHPRSIERALAQEKKRR